MVFGKQTIYYQWIVMPHHDLRTCPNRLNLCFFFRLSLIVLFAFYSYNNIGRIIVLYIFISVFILIFYFLIFFIRMDRLLTVIIFSLISISRSRRSFIFFWTVSLFLFALLIFCLTDAITIHDLTSFIDDCFPYMIYLRMSFLIWWNWWDGE